MFGLSLKAFLLAGVLASSAQAAERELWLNGQLMDELALVSVQDGKCLLEQDLSEKLGLKRGRRLACVDDAKASRVDVVANEEDFILKRLPLQTTRILTKPNVKPAVVADLFYFGGRLNYWVSASAGNWAYRVNNSEIFPTSVVEYLTDSGEISFGRRAVPTAASGEPLYANAITFDTRPKSYQPLIESIFFVPRLTFLDIDLEGNRVSSSRPTLPGRYILEGNGAATSTGGIKILNNVNGQSFLLPWSTTPISQPFGLSRIIGSLGQEVGSSANFISGSAYYGAQPTLTLGGTVRASDSSWALVEAAYTGIPYWAFQASGGVFCRKEGCDGIGSLALKSTSFPSLYLDAAFSLLPRRYPFLGSISFPVEPATEQVVSRAQLGATFQLTKIGLISLTGIRQDNQHTGAITWSRALTKNWWLSAIYSRLPDTSYAGVSIVWSTHLPGRSISTAVALGPDGQQVVSASTRPNLNEGINAFASKPLSGPLLASVGYASQFGEAGAVLHENRATPYASTRIWVHSSGVRTTSVATSNLVEVSTGLPDVQLVSLAETKKTGASGFAYFSAPAYSDFSLNVDWDRLPFDIGHTSNPSSSFRTGDGRVYSINATSWFNTIWSYRLKSVVSPFEKLFVDGFVVAPNKEGFWEQTTEAKDIRMGQSLSQARTCFVHKGETLVVEC